MLESSNITKHTQDSFENFINNCIRDFCNREGHNYQTLENDLSYEIIYNINNYSYKIRYSFEGSTENFFKLCMVFTECETTSIDYFSIINYIVNHMIETYDCIFDTDNGNTPWLINFRIPLHTPTMCDNFFEVIQTHVESSTCILHDMWHNQWDTPVFYQLDCGSSQELVEESCLFNE